MDFLSVQHGGSFETGTGSEYASEEGSDVSTGQQEIIEAEAGRQHLHQQYLLIRRLTEENRVLRQADFDNEEECSDLRLKLGSAQKRVVNFESLRRLRMSMEEDNDSLRASLAHEKGRTVTLDARVTGLEQDKSVLLARLAAAEDEEHTLRKRLECVQDDYNSALQLFGGNGSDDSSLAGIHEQLAQSADRALALEQRLADMMNTCNELRSDKSHMESEMADLRNRLRSSTPDLETIMRTQMQAPGCVGAPVNQSTPLRDGTNDLRCELLQTMGGNKSPLLGLERAALNVRSCISPTPSDGSVFDYKTSSSTSELLDVVSMFREHFEEKKKLALRHVADLSVSLSEDTEEDPGRSTMPLNGDTLSEFEEKLRKLVASRGQVAKKAAAVRHQLRAARAELATALEQRELSEKMAKDISTECEVLRQRLDHAEANRVKMAHSADSSNDSLIHPSTVLPSFSPTTTPVKSHEPNLTTSARKRLRDWDRSDTPSDPPLPSPFVLNKKKAVPEGPSLVRATGRWLSYFLLTAVIVMSLVLVVWPVLQNSSSTECCACPPPWAMKFFDNYLVPSSAQVAPL